MTEKYVTLPRQDVEQTLEALIYCEAPDSSSEEQRFRAVIAIRAALEQPIMSGTIRDFIEGMSVSVDVSTGEHGVGRRYFGTVTEVMDAPEDKHGVTLLVQDAEPNFEQPQFQSGGIPPDWKLVPVEPTHEMLCDAVMEWEGQAVYKVISAPGLRKLEEQAADGYRAMLDAAQQPSTVKECLTVEQQQVEQEQVAKVVLTEMLGLPCLQWLDLDRQFDFKGGELLYTHPQPKREPLTDEEIDKLCPQFDDPMRREMWIIGFKAAHNIK